MSVALLIFWGAVGWCGTPWRWPVPPPPPPWWVIDRMVGIVGGVIGGWLFTQAWPLSQTDIGLAVVASGVGAWVGATILHDLYGLIRGARSTASKH